jgi:hypothetical protein
MEHDIGPETTGRLVDFLKFVEEDRGARRLLLERFAGYHRSCAPGGQCATCGLSCLGPALPA